MKKSLLLALLLLVSQLNVLKAQGLFTAPDTICVKQPVYLTNNTPGGATYYWGFCSGYLKNPPIGNNLPALGLANAGAIEIANDNGHYFGFVANRNPNQLLRLDFGASLSNIPTVTNFGNVNNTLPNYTSGLTIVKDNAGKWFMFACGGDDISNASFARYDFGANLGGNPNAVNFGNPLSIMSHPRGLTIGYDNFNWYGFMVDSNNNSLLRLNFGNDLSLTPILNSFGNVGNLSGPSDVVAVKEGANWFLMVTNESNSTVTVESLSTSLSTVPVGANVGNLNNKLFAPSAITVIKDCGSTYAFITNKLNSNLTSVEITSMAGPFAGTLLGVLGGMNQPTAISTIIRERDNLYAFVPNAGDNSLTQVVLPQCTDPTIQSATTLVPPVYHYNTPGVYNVYLAVNEGRPDMQIDCKQIVVLPWPKISLSNDTVLCQGDSINLYVQSPNALSYNWKPHYNIFDTVGLKVKIWPEYTLDYHVTISYANGCIVDTPVHIDVSKVKADAGPDRLISDGSTTTLGGPLTTTNGVFAYNWSPSTFLSNSIVTNPTATPGYNITYYLEVTELNDNLGCKDIDTVVVHITCNDLNLPNAFAPETKVAGANTFGLLNKQIVKLNYFRIFDRWGKQVFSTSDPAKQWDGTVNGEPAPVGVYVWDADGFCLMGQRIKKQGNVTLIR